MKMLRFAPATVTVSPLQQPRWTNPTSFQPRMATPPKKKARERVKPPPHKRRKLRRKSLSLL